MAAGRLPLLLCLLSGESRCCALSPFAIQTTCDATGGTHQQWVPGSDGEAGQWKVYQPGHITPGGARRGSWSLVARGLVAGWGVACCAGRGSEPSALA